ALLTRMSIRPKRSRVRPTMDRIASGRVMSPGTASASGLSSEATASARSASRTLTATAAPRSTRRAATARPSPRAAPVTMATRPAKSRSMRSPGSLLVVGRLPVENPLDRLEVLAGLVQGVRIALHRRDHLQDHRGGNWPQPAAGRLGQHLHHAGAFQEIQIV